MLGFLDAGEFSLKDGCKDRPIRSTGSGTYWDDATHCISVILNEDKGISTLRLFTQLERGGEESYSFLLA